MEELSELSIWFWVFVAMIILFIPIVIGVIAILTYFEWRAEYKYWLENHNKPEYLKCFSPNKPIYKEYLSRGLDVNTGG